MSSRLFEIVDEAAIGSFLLFLGNALATFISALGAIVIARLLGPASYGLYSLSLALPPLLATLADFGIGPALTRYSAKLKVEDRRSQLAHLLKAGLSIKFLTGLFIMALSLTFSWKIASSILNRPEAGGFLALASTLILFQALSSTASSSLIGLDEMGSVSFIMIVQSIVRALASPLLIMIGLSILGAILGYTLSYAVAASIGLAILLNHYKEFRGGLKGKFEDPLLTMVRYGFPVYIASLLATMQAPYQNLVLAHFTSNVEIGNFNASLNFSALINLVVFPVTTVLFPAFSKLNPTSDNEHLKTMFTLTVKYVSFLLIPSSILVAILSKDLIFIIYGGGYSLAPLYLSMYMGTFLLAGLGYLILPNLFNGIGETKETMKMTLIVAFSFLSTAPLAAKVLRVPGLITASIISTLLGLIYGLTRAQKKYGLKIDWKAAAKISSAAVLASIPTLALTSSASLHALIDMILGGLSYIFTYMTAAALIGAVDKQDLSNLAQILQDRRMLRILANPILNYEAYLLKLRRCH